MRTTLTIDDDLMRDLKAVAAGRGISLKQLVNQILRMGLAEVKKPRNKKRYRCPTFSLGTPVPEFNLDQALALAAALEDDEIRRKLDLRK